VGAGRGRVTHGLPMSCATAHGSPCGLFILLISLPPYRHSLTSRNVDEDDVVGENDIIGKDNIVGEDDIIGEDNIVGENDIVGEDDIENEDPVALEGDSTEVSGCGEENRPALISGEWNLDNIRQSSPGSLTTTLPNEPASIPTVSATVNDPTVDQQFTLDGPATRIGRKRKARNLQAILEVCTCGQHVMEEEISSGRNIIRCTSTGCETQWVSWGFHNGE
jgi:hypothetical protein